MTTPDYWICAECGTTARMGPLQTYYCPNHDGHARTFTFASLNQPPLPPPPKLYPVIGGRVEWRRVR